jgi:membrane protease YdiL (CAAX protease family)
MYKSFLGKVFLLCILIIAGMSLSAVISSMWISPESIAEELVLETQLQRNELRAFLILGHLCSFLIPALIYLLIVYRNNILSFLNRNSEFSVKALFWSIILLFVAYPCIAYLTLVNTSIEFPDALIQMEETSLVILKGILQMDHWTEFAFNILLIGLLPAFGEELIFRGIMQNEVHRKWQNGHLAVWLTAFIFAFIHLQVQSFLPKLALGAVLGYVYLFSGNIWIPIILHFFNNSMQVVAMYVSGQDLDGIENMEEQKIPVYVALISIALVFWAGKQMKSIQIPKNNES